MGSEERYVSPKPDASLRPTWRGHVNTTMDALVLIEACLNGDLLSCARRPYDQERDYLVQSGNVFIYEEGSSGIKRWTDGHNWSPSRVLNDFLIYRELEKSLPNCMKKAIEKNNANKSGVRRQEGSNRTNSAGRIASTSALSTYTDSAGQSLVDRDLIGSLVDSYSFKENGLMKKTFSISINGILHHLVSYYKVEDIKSGRLVTPHSDLTLNLTSPIPRAELIEGRNFRGVIE
ncbi:hypothetical protein GQ53DRAFT_643399, partial [Thozetella sp. PMI_491]